MLNDKVKTVIYTEIVSVPENSTVFEAGEKMAENDIGAVIIVDKNNEPVGIFTERDFVYSATVLRKEGRDIEEINITEVMSSPVISINAEATIRKAAERMINKSIRRLLIVDDKNNPIGFCSLRDIIEASEITEIVDID